MQSTFQKQLKQSLLCGLLLLSIFGNALFAQTLAITEKGDTVYLFDNGTWSYSPDDYPERNEFSFLDEDLVIDTIPDEISIGKNNDKELISDVVQFHIKYNSLLWDRVPPATLNPEAEFALVSKDKNIYCLLIIEAVTIGTENIVKIAKNNMETRTNSVVKVVKTEARKVNGLDLLRAVFETNINGMVLTFDGYYYSDEYGTVQFMVWTSPNLHDKRESEILDLLNGFMVVE